MTPSDWKLSSIAMVRCFPIFMTSFLLSNLSAIHGAPHASHEALVEDSYAREWCNDPFYRGVFALFGPAQFYDSFYLPVGSGGSDLGASGGGESVTIFENLNIPAAQGGLHLEGEGTSTHHAWVLGALNAVWLAV
jgi:hypothetical protein